MKKILFLMMAALLSVGCSKEKAEDEKKSKIEIGEIPPVSISYEDAIHEIELPKDLSSIAVANIHDYNSDFIRDIKITKEGTKSKVTFWSQKNTETNRGYREGQIDIMSTEGEFISSFRVYQARNPFAPTKLQWCTEKATYDVDKLLDVVQRSNGKQITQFIYNLEKETNGKDSYKNYPAFAYCIEMNHDPANNMEWYLSDGVCSILRLKGGWAVFGYKEFWTTYGAHDGAISSRFSDNKVQCSEIKYSKLSSRYVYADNDAYWNK